MTWHPVTPTSPRPEELPVTVVRSRNRNLAYWTAYQQGGGDLSDECKDSVASYFEVGEVVYAEDWFSLFS